MALQSPYCKPTIPFSGPIHGGLKDGRTILVTGCVLKCCRRFQVDFQCGSCQMSRPDIAFHFNVRFDQNCIVCNSREKGGWRQEERNYDMVFCTGHPFEIQFVVNSSSYVVLIDGKLYLEFKHRIPLCRVDTIGISGEVDVESISFRGPTTVPDCSSSVFPISSQTVPDCSSSVFPISSQTVPDCSSSVFPISSQTVPDCSSSVFPISSQIYPVSCNPFFPTCLPPSAYPIGQCFPPRMYPLPYRATICGGFFPSKSIIVSGSVSPCAQRFEINLKVGNCIALHINPRFDQNAIVRNSLLNMCWGSEERHLPCGMPLMRGQPFTIWIQCEARCFKVAVNGHHQFDYNHRICNLRINLLEVDGDITLTNIQA